MPSRPTDHDIFIPLAAATARAALHALSLSDGDGGLGVCGRGTHALLDLAGHGQEGLLDIGGALGRRLKEWDAETVCEFLQAMSAMTGS